MSRKTGIFGYNERYSPWELLELKPQISTKSDIWSLGCVIFYIFTGEHPFVKVNND